MLKIRLYVLFSHMYDTLHPSHIHTSANAVFSCLLAPSYRELKCQALNSSTTSLRNNRPLDLDLYFYCKHNGCLRLPWRNKANSSWHLGSYHQQCYR